MTTTERRTGQLLSRAENGVASGGLRIDGSSALTTTYGAPVAKVATVPRPAFSLWHTTRVAWPGPETWDELFARYHAPGGLLEGEHANA